MTPRSSRRRGLLMLSAASALIPLAAPALADGRPIRIVVPGPPGSAMDSYLRAISEPFSRLTGHPMVVDNLPGAGGTLATAQVARAAPDGLTLEIVSSNHVINPSLFKSLPYDALESFEPITVIGVVPLVLVVSPTLEARTVQELVSTLKTLPPGTYNYGSLGIGTALHLAGELFDAQAGVKTTHVPYREAGALTADLMNGQVQMAYLALPSVAQLVKAGKLRALALTTREPSPALPGVPPMAEALPDYAFEAWLALIAPKGVPAEVIQRYYQAVKTAMEEPSVQAAIAAQGLVPVVMPPQEAGAYFRTELDKHAVLVQRSGATPQ